MNTLGLMRGQCTCPFYIVKIQLTRMGQQGETIITNLSKRLDSNAISRTDSPKA